MNYSEELKKIGFKFSNGAKRNEKKWKTSSVPKNFKSFGFDFFDNKISEKEDIDLIKRNTKKYAKKQMTWFKRDRDIKWFEKIDNSIFEYVKKIIV